MNENEKPTTERTNKEIGDLLDAVSEAVDDGKRKYPGMSYEEGVIAGVRWILGLDDDHPYED